MLVTFPTRVTMIRCKRKVETVFFLDLRICVNLGFCRGVDEVFALLGYGVDW